MPRSPSWEVMPAETPPSAEVGADMPGIRIADPMFTLTLMSEPPGAEIYMNDQLVGVAPVQLTVPEGQVTMRAELEGYASAPHSFVVDQDLDARITMVTVEEANRPTEVCEHRGRGFVLA